MGNESRLDNNFINAILVLTAVYDEKSYYDNGQI